MTIHIDGFARVEFNGQDLTPYLAGAPRATTGVLDRIDNTIAGLCPCGADPRDGSPYCSADCEPTHISDDTGYSAMRWRPDLVTAHDDTDLIAFDVVRAAPTVAIREGRHNAHIYQRVSEPTTWHLRLDDGHRYAGCDLAGMGAVDGIISLEQTARIHDAWQRLGRELNDRRRTEPATGGMVGAAYPGPLTEPHDAIAQLRVDRERVLAWLQANGLDPDQMPEQGTIAVHGNRITVQYVVRDESGAIMIDGHGAITAPRTVPLLQPWTNQ
ncbi:hypothetical protein MED01_002374 [Micromonospora sp. MED01]|uniref:hypothetical protein n=1 Tax=Micromonospora alfalfae TaxID=2911212 RepID=UPI001EE8DD73|nr:hypothetical protein [Micromonospora alfalfae]MCG5464209.1 hypothetical protein [Micromonospora alfalfae]